MKHQTKLAIVILAIFLCALQFTALPCSAQSVRIKHVVIIIQEGRSLDSMFGQFAGVNGATSGDYLGTTVSLKDALLISQPRPAVGGCFRIGDPGPVSDPLALCEGWTGLVVHDQSEFSSLLAFAENVYSLAPLTSRDAAANNLMDAFDFSQEPLPPLILNPRQCLGSQ